MKCSWCNRNPEQDGLRYLLRVAQLDSLTLYVLGQAFPIAGDMTLDIGQAWEFLAFGLVEQVQGTKPRSACPSAVQLRLFLGFRADKCGEIYM